MSARMTNPIQKPQKLPATNPDRMFKDAPPWPEQETISRTCRDRVLTKILVTSMINGPASVPQEMMPASTHQRFGSGAPEGSAKSRSNSQLAAKMTRMDTRDVSQTRLVSGCSQLNSFLLPKSDWLAALLR